MRNPPDTPGRFKAREVGLVDKNQPASATWCAARTGTEANDFVLNPVSDPRLSLRHADGKLWIGSKTQTVPGSGPNTDLFDKDSTFTLGQPWSSSEGGNNTTEAAWAIQQRAEREGQTTATMNLVCGLKDNGCWQDYRGPISVYWSPSTGALAVWGAMKNTYQRTANAENGKLGYPIARELCGLRDNGCRQDFQGGSIYWTSQLGTKIIDDMTILNKYRSIGAENGEYRYPTSNVICGLRNGGCYANFQGLPSGPTSIILTPTKEAFLSQGGIRAEWANQNYEKGRLCYPTSDEIYPAPGEAYQTYEGGTIFYKAGQGTRIQYK